MTIFDIMPSLWLLSSVLFAIFCIICNSDAPLCALCSSLFSFAFSLLSLPIYIQCFSFIGICFALFIGSLISQKRKRKEKFIFCAVCNIDMHGGYAKLNGNIFPVYSRDKYVKYRCGELFNAKRSADTYILWGKDT